MVNQGGVKLAHRFCFRVMKEADPKKRAPACFFGSWIRGVEPEGGPSAQNPLCN